MHPRYLRPVLTGATLLLLFIMTALPAGATARQDQHPQSRPSSLMAFPHQTIKHIAVSRQQGQIDLKGTNFLYVEDGTCTDAIDVYKIGNPLTFVGNFPNDGCRSFAYYGTQSIAIAEPNHTHGPCLVYGDQNGFVDSFPIDPSTGALGSEASHISSAAPADVHIAENGRIAYVSSPGIDLESYSLGAGCVLTSLVTVPTSELYISFALASSTRLVTTDQNTGTIDTWKLSTNGGMSIVRSVASQIAQPDAIAIQSIYTRSGLVTNVFTGQATFNPPQAQGGQYTMSSGALKFLHGSPAVDPNPAASDGAAITFDSTHNLLIQGEQVSGMLGVYSVTTGKPGKPGSMAFMKETPLAVGGESPTAFVQRGSTLFVDGLYNGDIEACSLKTSGVTACTTVAVLTYATGSSQGIAIL
ncbi:MAG: hypothetical protein ABI456_04155 [Ktedonobacteraceae bacterium]|nr:lactonase family protein [Chloroflexota bacterium]